MAYKPVKSKKKASTKKKKQFRTKPVWKMEIEPVQDTDDRRGKYRFDVDKVMSRAYTRYLGQIWELFTPDMEITVTDSYMNIKVASLTTLTSPQVIINGNVTINGNLQVNGYIHATGDIVAGGVSLMHHTHPGCMGGSTGSPS